MLKAELSIFFLVGPVSSTLEDSSTVEYSECGLIRNSCARTLNIIINQMPVYVFMHFQNKFFEGKSSRILGEKSD